VPPDNFVEANFTRETGGVSPFPHKTAPHKGNNLGQTLPASSFFPPIPISEMGPQKDVLWYNQDHKIDTAASCEVSTGYTDRRVSRRL